MMHRLANFKVFLFVFRI